MHRRGSSASPVSPASHDTWSFQLRQQRAPVKRWTASDKQKQEKRRMEGNETRCLRQRRQRPAWAAQLMAATLSDSAQAFWHQSP